MKCQISSVGQNDLKKLKCGKVIWITGLSGAGKTSVSKELYEKLSEKNIETLLLDGDTLRKIFLKKNNFSDKYDRQERINLAMQYAYLCKVLSLQGLNIIIATISMFEEIYKWNRENLPNYFQIYLKVPIDELELRDPKKIYKQFRAGALTNVAGLDLSVDYPLSSDVTLDFIAQPDIWESPAASADYILSRLLADAAFN